MKKADPGITTGMHRRRFLNILTAGAALTLPVGWVCADDSNLWVPDDLPVTPAQVEGPFYPIPSIEQQLFNDTDLTRKLPEDELALGQLVHVNGVVMSQKGMPLKDAVVEIWQASSAGLYNHPDDSAEHPDLDHDFQFWGRFVTGADGAYSFTSIIPGEYTGRTARHIHFRVDAPGYSRLITQSYFSQYGDRNMQDGIYRRLNQQGREALTVEFENPRDEAWQGAFNIVLAVA